MVDIVVVQDGKGCLSRMSLNGHAGYGTAGSGPAGRLRNFFRRNTGKSVPVPIQDPACAAVTLMARTIARLTASREGWIVDGTAPEPGNLSLAIKRRPEDTDEWLRGVTDTLMKALADIDEEYPGSITVSLEEFNNGS